MIGEVIRRKQASLTRKYMNKIFDNPKYRDVLPRFLLDKIISFAIGFNDFVLSLAFFFSLLFIFFSFVLPRLGFDKTIILLLVIIIFVLRSFLEKLGSEDSPIRKKF